MDSVERFSDRADDYARFRPGYPDGVVRALESAGGLRAPSTIADVGFGTGKLAEVFLKAGYVVIGVEPNEAMRGVARQALAGFPALRLVGGTAEQLPLGTGSINAIVVGQAFHWFNPERTRTEFQRVLRSGGWVALLWNDRRYDRSAFLREYEALLRRYCATYTECHHQDHDAAGLQPFFGREPLRTAEFPNHQELSFPELRGRLLSASYVPTSGPDHEALMQHMRELFDRFQVAGRVEMACTTRMYYGRLT